MAGIRSTTRLLLLTMGVVMMAGRVFGSEVSGANLVGVWGCEQVVGPRIRGELTLDARGTEWVARIAGFETPVTRSGGEIRSALPEGLGEFRGRGDKETKTIRGFWIQPVGNFFPQRYATPVQLISAGNSVWTGEVHPLDERMTLYLSIRRAPDGALKAVFRNPDFGGLSRGTWHIEIKENGSVRIIGDGDGGDTLQATYEAQSDRLLIHGDIVPDPVAFTRKTDADAVGFYPRTPRQEPSHYAYRQPLQAKDGWKTASLQDVGIDPKPISELIQAVLAADPNDENFFSIHSLLIARHGKLVLEEYFRGFDRERPHDMRSAGKTFAPMLVGAAREQGANVAPDTPVYALFPQYKPFANWDERKNKLTLEHLMTMTPGLASDDYDGASPGGEDRMQSQKEQPDWYKYTLDLPMARDPGGKTAIYSSASLNLVGGVVERATGIWNAELFDRYIARPLQFGIYHLNLTPTGSVYMGGGAYVRPRDELKIGQLYLAGGKWNGRRIVSRNWVEQSTASHATSFQKPVIASDTDHQYGYGWHLYHFTVNNRVYRAYSAGGNGGQWVLVVPDLDMVVGINGGSYRNADVWYRWGLEVFPRYLIPAATSGATLHPTPSP